MSKKRTPLSLGQQDSTVASKQPKFATTTFTCPNKLCGRSFKTQRQLSGHFYGAFCEQTILKNDFTNPTQSQINTKQPHQQSNKKAESDQTDTDNEDNNIGINFDYVMDDSDESDSNCIFPESSSSSDYNYDSSDNVSWGEKLPSAVSV